MNPFESNKNWILKRFESRTYIQTDSSHNNILRENNLLYEIDGHWEYINKWCACFTQLQTYRTRVE